MLVIFPLLTLAMVVLWVVLARLTHKASVASITVAIAFPIAVALAGHDAGDIIVISVLALLVVAPPLVEPAPARAGRGARARSRRTRRAARRRRRARRELTGSVDAVSNSSVKKAVIPAAGLGTRFLPATKSQPKEMLPVVDKPSIQYVVEEAVAGGPHRHPHHHRAGQARHRGPLRPQLRARALPRAVGEARPARRGAGRSTSSPTSTTSASAIRSASATR